MGFVRQESRNVSQALGVFAKGRNGLSPMALTRQLDATVRITIAMEQWMKDAIVRPIQSHVASI